jgi:hypothetical protein
LALALKENEDEIKHNWCRANHRRALRAREETTVSKMGIRALPKKSSMKEASPMEDEKIYSLAELTIRPEFLGGVKAILKPSKNTTPCLELRWDHGLTPIFIAQGVGLVIYALINVAAVAGGAWFGPIGWPRSVTLETSRATGRESMRTT